MREQRPLFRLEKLEPRVVLSHSAIHAFEGDSLSWIDSSTNQTMIAGVSDGDLVLFAGDGRSSWTHRNLSDELGVSSRLGTQLAHWESPDGRAGIAGIDVNGHAIVFQETGLVLRAPAPPTPPEIPTEPSPPSPPVMPWQQGHPIIERVGWTSNPGMIAEARRNPPFTGQREIIKEFGVFEFLPPDYQPFVIAHEYGHHLLGHVDLYHEILWSGRYDLFHEAEFEADCYAAETMAIEYPHRVFAAINFLASHNHPASPTHPANVDRIAVIDSCARSATARWDGEVAAYRAAYATYELELASYQDEYERYVGEYEEYQRLLREYSPLDEWELTRVGENDLRVRGKQTPRFEGVLTAFTLSWGGITVAGTSTSGDLEAIWWAPGLPGWDTVNLAELTGLSGIESNLVSFVTSWDGMNIGGLTEDGSIRVAWWTPQTDRWSIADITRSSGAPSLDGDLVSYVTPWGAMNVIGTTRSGDLYGVWWTPRTRWVASDLSGLFGAAPPVDGGLAAFVELDGRTNIVARGSSSNSFAIWWSPTSSGWNGEFLSKELEDLLWTGHRFDGSGNGLQRRGLAAVSLGSMHWALWDADSEWEVVSLTDLSRAAVLWPHD